MKPLLRAVLLVDAVLLAAFGVLFVLTPWKGLYSALQLVSTDPAMVGQAFGIALLGLAWLAAHAAINGDLTTGVARAVGHVNWLSGVVMLAWLVGLHKPSLSGFGQLVSVVAGIVLVVLGLGGVRLASAVRRRERAQAAAARMPKAPDVEPRTLPSPAATRTEPGLAPAAAPAWKPEEPQGAATPGVATPGSAAPGGSTPNASDKPGPLDTTRTPFHG